MNNLPLVLNYAPYSLSNNVIVGNDTLIINNLEGRSISPDLQTRIRMIVARSNNLHIVRHGGITGDNPSFTLTYVYTDNEVMFGIPINLLGAFSLCCIPFCSSRFRRVVGSLISGSLQVNYTMDVDD